MRIVLFWLFIIGLQVVLLNHLDLSAYLIPQVFILLLIKLPLNINKMYQVLIAFGLGLLMDMFTSTPGIHASACLWLIIIRIGLLSGQDLKEHEANKATFSANTAGLAPFMYTTIILVFFYHLYIFWLESIGALNWSLWLTTFIVSSISALTVMGIIEYLSFTNYDE
ncbi:hypothetical protein OAD66_00300 [Bacteroidia bacterium]|nr:hypothetical protein [Bacteroidia bacterium]